MVEHNQQYAYFTIVDGFDPAEITSRVGVQPTKCWKKGSIDARRGMHWKISRWSLHSRLDRNLGIEDHIRDVLAQLDTNPEAFRSVSLEFGGCMQLVGFFRREYPGLHFELDIIEGFARYALAVDFDFYGPSATEGT